MSEADQSADSTRGSALICATAIVAGVLIGFDGLHPNEAGYQRMAETFYAEIRRRLELP